MRFHYVYVLQSLKDKKLYIGSTSDLKQRIADHNRGHNKSTATRRPFVLIFYKAFPSKKDIIRRESPSKEKTDF